MSQDKSSPVFLSGVNYYMGELKDISEVEFLKDNPEKLKSYYEMGFKTYAVSSIPAIEMAYHSIKKSLDELKMSPDEVDALLYVAESKGRDEVFSSYEVNMMLNYLGMKNTYPIGLSLSDCANSIMGLRTAEAMVKSGQAKNVMVVCTNRYSSKPNARMMDQDVAVCSDAAVSALVSSTPGAYEILGTGMIKNEPSPENAPPLDASIKKIKALRIITNTLLEKVSLAKADIDKIYTNNYFELSEIFIESCGFDTEKGFYQNLEKYGHCLAGDTLISLKDQEESNDPGQKIFLLCDGPYGSFAICLHKTK